MSDSDMLARALLVVGLVTVAEARPRLEPATQALACPDDAERCDLTIEGTLTYSKRDRHAKWDNLRFRARVDGKVTILYASINIPNRTRLTLAVGTRYRFTISAEKPFGAGNLWVTNAKAL